MSEPSFFIFTSLFLILSFVALSWFAGTDAPFVATKMDLIRNILKKAGVKKGKKFYELGSGDGRVVLEAAKLGAESIGIEQSLLRVLYSRFLALKNNLSNAKFIHGNIFEVNYSHGDIIYIFLLPVGIKKLEPKLKSELKKGSVIITQRYHFENIKPFSHLGEFNFYRF
jgi:precorrin-6B methylase 2